MHSYPGGASDIAMQKRLQRRHHPDASALTAAVVGSKQSARDRLVGQQGGGTAIMVAIQQSPEWLRPFLLLLPASKLRLAMVAKPPPQMTESALATLRQSSLPAERPIERKRKRSNSSDEDDGAVNASGYGIAFRKRQQARMVEHGIGLLN